MSDLKRDCQHASSVINTTITLDTTIGELLERLAMDPVLLVCEGHGDSVALISVSDLDRHIFAARIYLPLAELEARLVSLIESSFEDHWEWLNKLDHGAKVQLLGNWEIKKQMDANLGITKGATLNHMLKVIRATPTLCARLGFHRPAQFKRVGFSVTVLRNRVMHPIRPLVSGSLPSHARTLKEQIQSVLDLTARVVAAIDNA